MVFTNNINSQPIDIVFNGINNTTNVFRDIHAHLSGVVAAANKTSSSIGKIFSGLIGSGIQSIDALTQSATNLFSNLNNIAVNSAQKITRSISGVVQFTMDTLTRSLFRATNQAVTTFNQKITAPSLLPFKSISTFYSQIHKQAAQTLQTNVKLSDVLRGMADIGYAGGKGLLGFSDRTDIEKEIVNKLKKPLARGLRSSITGIDAELFGKQVKTRGLPGLSKDIAPTLLTTAKLFGKINPSLLTFIDRLAPISSMQAIPQMSGLPSLLQQGLKQINLRSTSGLSNDILNIGKEYATEYLASRVVKKMATNALGFYFEALDQQIGPGIEKIISKTIKNASPSIQRSGLQYLDAELFGASGYEQTTTVERKIQPFLEDFSQRIVNQLGTTDFLKNISKFSSPFLAASPITETIGRMIEGRGSASRFLYDILGVEPITNMLSGLPGFKQASEGINNLLGNSKLNQVPGLASLFQNIDKLRGSGVSGKIFGSIADMGLESLSSSPIENLGLILNNTVGKNIAESMLTNLAGTSINAVGEFLAQQTPEWMVSLKSKVFDKLPEPIERVANALGEDARSIFSKVQNYIREQSSIYGAGNQKIEKLQQQLKKLDMTYLNNRRRQLIREKGRLEAYINFIDVTDTRVKTAFREGVGGSGLRKSGRLRDNAIRAAYENANANQFIDLPEARRQASSKAKNFVDNELPSLFKISATDKSYQLFEQRKDLVNQLQEAQREFAASPTRDLKIKNKIKNLKNKINKISEDAISGIVTDIQKVAPSEIKNNQKVIKDINRMASKAIDFAIKNHFRGFYGMSKRIDAQAKFRQTDNELQQIKRDRANLFDMPDEEITRQRSGIESEIKQLQKGIDRAARESERLKRWRQELTGDNFLRADKKRFMEAQLLRPTLDDSTQQEYLLSLGRKSFSRDKQKMIFKRLGKSAEPELMEALIDSNLGKHSRQYYQAVSEQIRLLESQRNIGSRSEQRGVNDTIAKLNKRLSALQQFNFQYASGAEKASPLTALVKRLRNDATLTQKEMSMVRSIINKEIDTTTKNYQSGFTKTLNVAKNAFSQLSQFPQFAKGLKIVEQVETWNVQTNGAIADIFKQSGRTIGASVGKGILSGFMESIYPFFDAFDNQILGTAQRIQQVPQRFAQVTGFVSNVANNLVMATDAAGAFWQKMTVVGRVVNSFMNLGNALFMIQQGFSIITMFAQQNPIATVIRQNTELEQQILRIQSGIIATNKLVDKTSGRQINGLDSFAQTKPLIERSIESLRKRSLDLATFTSSDLIEPFSIVTGMMGGIGASLQDAIDLTVSFASGLSTINLPANQATQEIRSILMGDITNDSLLAKTLDVRNPTIKKWKLEGKLIENLQERLSSLVQGQEIASKNVSGLTSNILDFFQEVQRISGRPLFETFRAELDKLYTYLVGSQQKIMEFAHKVAAVTNRAFKGVIDTIKELVSVIVGKGGGETGLFVLESIANIIEIVRNSVKNTLRILQPFIDAFKTLVGFVTGLGSPLIKAAIQFKVLTSGISIFSGMFGMLTRVLPGVGGLMSLLAVRTLPLINQFGFLSKNLGGGAAAFLTLGKNMAFIPGMTTALTRFLGVLGPLAPALTAVLPAISGLAIQGAGLGGIIRGAGALNLITKAIGALPIGIQGLGAMANNRLASLGLNPRTLASGQAAINSISFALQNYVTANIAATQNTSLLNIVVRNISAMFRAWALKTVLLTGTIYGLFKAFNALTSQTELMEFLGSNLKAFGESLVALKDFLTTGFSGAVTAVIVTLGLLATSFARDAAIVRFVQHTFFNLTLTLEKLLPVLINTFSGLANFTQAIAKLPVVGSFFQHISLHANKTAYSLETVGKRMHALRLDYLFTNSVKTFNKVKKDPNSTENDKTVARQAMEKNRKDYYSYLSANPEAKLQIFSGRTAGKVQGLGNKIAGLGDRISRTNVRMRVIGKTINFLGLKVQGLGNKFATLGIKANSAFAKLPTFLKMSIVMAKGLAGAIAGIIGMVAPLLVLAAAIQAVGFAWKTFVTRPRLLQDLEDSRKKLAETDQESAIAMGKMKKILEETNEERKHGIALSQKQYEEITYNKKILEERLKTLKIEKEILETKMQQANLSDTAVREDSKLTSKSLERIQKYVEENVEIANSTALTDKSIKYRKNEIIKNARVTKEDLSEYLKLRKEKSFVQNVMSEIGDSNSFSQAFKGQIEAIDKEIKANETLQEKYTSIQPRDLPLAGNMLKQIGDNADLAWSAIQNPTGDAELFKKNLENVTKLNSQLYELGQISAEEAIEKITKVTETQVEATTGQIEAAYKAILGLIDKQAAEVSDRISRRQKELEAEAATGEINKVTLHARTVELQREDMLNKKRATQRKLDEAWRMDDLKSVAKFQNEVANLENQITATVAEETRKWYELSRADIEEDAQETLAVEKNRFEAGMTGLVNHETTKKNILSESYAKQRQLLTKQINSLNTQDIEGREKLIAEKMALYEKERQAQQQFYQALEKDLKASLDRSKVLLDKDRAEGEILESTYLEDELKLTDKYAQDRYNLIRKQLTGGRELSIEARKDLMSELEKIDLESIESDRKYFEARLSLIKEYGEVEKNVLAGQLATGGITSQADFLSQEFDLIKGTRNNQIGEIFAELENPKISEKRRNQLRSQLGQLQQEDKQARKSFFDSRMQLLSEAQQNEIKLQDVARQTNQINSAKANQKEYETTSQYLSDRLQLIKSELAKEEPLTVEEREKMQVQLAEIELEEKTARQKLFDSQLDLLTKIFEKESAIRNSAHELGKLKSAKYYQETYRETAKNLSDRIKLIQDRLQKESQLTASEKQDLVAQIAQLEVEQKTARQKLFDEEMKLIESFYQKVSVVQEEAYNYERISSIEYYQDQYNATKSQLNAKLEMLQEKLETETTLTLEEKQKLQIEISKINIEMLNEEQKYFDARIKLIESASNHETALLSSQLAQGLVSQRNYNQQTFNEELQLLNKRRSLIQKRLRDTLNPETRQNLEMALAKTFEEANGAAERYFDNSVKLLDELSNYQTMSLEKSIMSGAIGEEQYESKKLQQTINNLSQRQKLVEEHYGRLAKSAENRQKLESEITKIAQEREKAHVEYIDKTIAIAERKMQTAMDVIKLSELEFQKLTRQLVAFGDGTLDRNQLKRRALAEEYTNTKKQLELQLRLHRDLNQIKFDDPRRQEEHQQKIRNSLKQTTELEIRLLDLQREKFEQMLDTKVAKARNEVTATVQEMEKQLNPSNFNKQVLDQQSTLVSTRQSLNNSLVSLVRNEFEIAEKLEKSDRKRQQIKEAAAKYEIQALEYQQQLKQQALEIEIRQMQISQERAEIENEIARIHATAQIAEAQANLAKTKADPNASNEQIIAAELELRARQMEVDALGRQRGLILGQRYVMGQQIKAKIIEDEISNIIASRKAQLRLAESYDNPTIKRVMMEKIKQGKSFDDLFDFNFKVADMVSSIQSEFDKSANKVTSEIGNEFGALKKVISQEIDILGQKINKTSADSNNESDGLSNKHKGIMVSPIIPTEKNYIETPEDKERARQLEETRKIMERVREEVDEVRDRTTRLPKTIENPSAVEQKPWTSTEEFNKDYWDQIDINKYPQYQQDHLREQKRQMEMWNGVNEWYENGGIEKELRKKMQNEGWTQEEMALWDEVRSMPKINAYEPDPNSANRKKRFKLDNVIDQKRIDKEYEREMKRVEKEAIRDNFSLNMIKLPTSKINVEPINSNAQSQQGDRSLLSSIGREVRKIATEIKNIGKSGVGDITINNTATAGDTQDLMAQMKNQTLKTLDGVLEKTMKMQYG